MWQLVWLFSYLYSLRFLLWHSLWYLLMHSLPAFTLSARTKRIESIRIRSQSCEINLQKWYHVAGEEREVNTCDSLGIVWFGVCAFITFIVSWLIHWLIHLSPHCTCVCVCVIFIFLDWQQSCQLICMHIVPGMANRAWSGHCLEAFESSRDSSNCATVQHVACRMPHAAAAWFSIVCLWQAASARKGSKMVGREAKNDKVGVMWHATHYCVAAAGISLARPNLSRSSFHLLPCP